MIRHIVLFRIKQFPSADEKSSAAQKVKSALLEMRPKIDVIADFEVGINFTQDPSAWDVVLHSTFRSREDLETYRVHPDHQAFIAFNKNYSEMKAVADYEF